MNETTWLTFLRERRPLFPTLPLIEPNEGFDVAAFSLQQRDMFGQHWNIPIIACIAYIVIIFGLKYVILPGTRARPLQLKWSLAVWNFSLALFSIVGAVRVVPIFFDIWSEKGAHGSFCTKSLSNNAPFFYDSIAGWWLVLFAYSKFFELVDTLLLVVRQKRLLFLHWYHHVTVLLYCWMAIAQGCQYGHAFAGMNLVVHSIMYTYYGLSGLHIRPIPPILVTVIQIAQMICGSAIVSATGFFYFFDKRGCDVDVLSLYAGFVMYSSYLYLFVAFFVKRFVSKPAAKGYEPAGPVNLKAKLA